MFETVLKNGCKALNISLDETTVAQLKRYCDYMLEYNNSVNLTAITAPDEAASKHFLDSLTVLPLIPQGASCCDVGTGAGFPGMVLAIVRPDITMTLFDSLDKRLEFLRRLAAELNVTNITCVHARAEDAGANPLYREKYDVVLSRAVARMQVLCELTLPFARVGGKLVALKGPAATQELACAERALRLLGGGNATVKPAALDGQEHVIVTVQKLRRTDKQYPRRAGTPAKQPL